MGISGLPDWLLRKCRYGASMSEAGDRHDEAYTKGGTICDKIKADNQLFRDLWKSGHYVSAPAFWCIVSVVGLLPSHWSYRTRPLSDFDYHTMARLQNKYKSATAARIADAAARDYKWLHHEGGE